MCLCVSGVERGECLHAVSYVCRSKHSSQELTLFLLWVLGPDPRSPGLDSKHQTAELSWKFHDQSDPGTSASPLQGSPSLLLCCYWTSQLSPCLHCEHFMNWAYTLKIGILLYLFIGWLVGWLVVCVVHWQRTEGNLNWFFFLQFQLGHSSVW